MHDVILIPRKFLAWLLPLLLSLAACQGSDSPAATALAATAPAQAEASAEAIAHGEYLVRIGGCNDCHTPGYGESGGQTPKSEWLLGSSLGHHGPWGTAYPSNLRLTVDKLSEQEWMTYSANLRTRPLMPDFTLRAMSDRDRRALYHFIKSLGPAGEPAPQGLPPGIRPPAPYLELVLPAGAAPVAPVAAG